MPIAHKNIWKSYCFRARVCIITFMSLSPFHSCRGNSCSNWPDRYTIGPFRCKLRLLNMLIFECLSISSGFPSSDSLLSILAERIHCFELSKRIETHALFIQMRYIIAWKPHVGLFPRSTFWKWRLAKIESIVKILTLKRYLQLDWQRDRKKDLSKLCFKLNLFLCFFPYQNV